MTFLLLYSIALSFFSYTIARLSDKSRLLTASVTDTALLNGAPALLVE